MNHPIQVIGLSLTVLALALIRILRLRGATKAPSRGPSD